MMTPDNIVDKEHLTMDSEVLGRSEEKWFALALGCDGNADCGEKYESLSFKEGMKRETFPIGLLERSRSKLINNTNKGNLYSKTSIHLRTVLCVTLPRLLKKSARFVIVVNALVMNSKCF